MNEIKWSNGLKPIRSNKCDKKLYDNNKINNKREQLNDKINQRELIQNTLKNPFFDSQDYIQHLSVQDQFLRPQKIN